MQSEQISNGQRRMLFFEEGGLLFEEKKAFHLWEAGKNSKTSLWRVLGEGLRADTHI